MKVPYIMKNMLYHIFICVLHLGLFACSGSDETIVEEPKVTEELEVIEERLTFTKDGGQLSYTIKSNVRWTIESSAPWCTTELNEGQPGNKQILVTTAPNTDTEPRTATLTVKAGNLKRTTEVVQAGSAISMPADKTGMESDAPTLAKKIKLGWNLGNAMEVPGSETNWGNPKTTQAMIDMVKAAGFNAVRIPCAWDSYIEDPATQKIKSAWLARVKEVVSYCVNNDMYAILNIHWDGGWLEANPTYAKQEEVNAKQKALWEQIAVYMRDFDEHLLFAGTNEVHANYNTPTKENIEVQLSYNQTFVDAVRSTGGRNSYRNLIVQAYNTNIDYAVQYLTPATDPTPNRMMVEVHYYDPYDFCLKSDSDNKFLWGKDHKGSANVDNWGQEDHVLTVFGKMKTNFIDKGYPVILGEYCATRRSSLTGNDLTRHLAARAYYHEYVTTQAKNHGLVPFYWDNGGTGNHASGIFNRAALQVADQATVDALVRGRDAGVYP